MSQSSYEQWRMARNDWLKKHGATEDDVIYDDDGECIEVNIEEGMEVLDLPKDLQSHNEN